MAIRHNGAATGGGGLSCNTVALRIPRACVDGCIVAIPDAGMGVLRTKNMAQLVGDNHYAERIRWQIGKKATHTSYTHLEGGIRAAKAIHYRNATTSFVSNQFCCIAIKTGAGTLKLRQYCVRIRSGIRAAAVPNEHLRQTQTHIFIGI